MRAYIAHDATPHGRRSPTTTQRYYGLLHNHEPLWEPHADRIESETIENFYYDLLAAGLSPTTVHHVHNLLFAWTVGLFACKPETRSSSRRP